MKYKNELAVLGAALGWGLIGLFTRNLSASGVSSGGVLIIRAVGCTLCFGLYLLFKGIKSFRIEWKHLPLFLAYGLSTLFFTYCYYSSIELVSMSVACTLMFTAPIFVMLMSIPVFHEKFRVRKLLALIIVTAGVTLVSGILDGGVRFNALGVLLGLLSGIGYAVYNIFSKLLSQRNYTVWQICFYGWGICAVGGILIWGPASAAPGVSGLNGILLCVGMVIVSGFIPALLYNWALGRIEASRASMMGTLEPVVATVAGAAAFGEKLTVFGILGIILILGGVALLNVKTKSDAA